MSKRGLEVLFDSRVRLKMLKFLFRNIGSDFSPKEMTVRIQEQTPVVKKEIKKFLDMGLLKVKKI